MANLYARSTLDGRSTGAERRYAFANLIPGAVIVQRIRGRRLFPTGMAGLKTTTPRKLCIGRSAGFSEHSIGAAVEFCLPEIRAQVSLCV